MLSLVRLRNAFGRRKHYQPFWQTYEDKDASEGITYEPQPEMRYSVVLKGACLALTFATILLGSLLWSEQGDMDRTRLLHSSSYCKC